MRMSVMPAPTASSITYWIVGLSTTGSISFGCALVAGRNRVPSPAAGMTALVTAMVGLSKGCRSLRSDSSGEQYLETELFCADHSITAARLGFVHRLICSIDQSLLRQTMFGVRGVADGNGDLDRLVVLGAERR